MILEQKTKIFTCQKCKNRCCEIWWIILFGETYRLCDCCYNKTKTLLKELLNS